MALIKCYECEKEYSDTLDRCPHCGAYPKTSTNETTDVNKNINVNINLNDDEEIKALQIKTIIASSIILVISLLLGGVMNGGFWESGAFLATALVFSLIFYERAIKRVLGWYGILPTIFAFGLLIVIMIIVMFYLLKINEIISSIIVIAVMIYPIYSGFVRPIIILSKLGNNKTS